MSGECSLIFSAFLCKLALLHQLHMLLLLFLLLHVAVAVPQLCQEHGISKDGMLEDFATQVSDILSTK